MDLLTLDGRQGEGGGQILRSGLALSAVLGRPFELTHIRGGRKRPGLKRQHLACVRAAAEITGCEAVGASLDSDRILLEPGPVRPGSYTFSVGSAGSCNLVLQTVLMPLLLADAPSELVLEGGTHNSMAPPTDALAMGFLPLVERMGGRVELTLERAGFVPAGGGRVRVRIEPATTPQPLELLQRGPDAQRSAVIDYAHLGDAIPRKQARLLRTLLPLLGDNIELREHDTSPGPGNAISVFLGFRHVCEVFTCFGAKSVPSRRLVASLARSVKRYLASDAPVGSHLADQLLLPMALLGGGTFATTPTTEHTTTNADVINAFLGEGTASFEDGAQGIQRVHVKPVFAAG